MMSDDDDFDFSSTNRSSNNLATLFTATEPAAPPVARTVTAPLKQPKKDAQPRVMIVSAVQAFSFVEQKWATRGKMGLALLSTENTSFQLILYVTKNQTITSLRIQPNSVLTSQANNYLSFQDDSGVNWSMMFETKQALVEILLQILLAKAFLLAFKFEQLTQEIREGEGSSLVDQDGVEITVHLYKLLENGTLSPTETAEPKPVRLKIGKHQNGKVFDEVLKGMKKNGHRLAMIGTMIYSIEVLRIKREKEARASSITITPDEPPLPTERKSTATDENEHPQEKSKMMQRINKMGGVSMLPNPSAFAAPLPSFSDDDSINNEFVPPAARAAPPPVQFVPPTYHHPYLPAHLYPAQPPIPEYHSRPGSSMGPTNYPPMSHPWASNPYPPPAPSVPPADPYYSTPTDVRQFFHRLTEKVDLLLETKASPNMETGVLLANIQRIVKENETMKKDLFDRTAKIEEQNLKISELLERNQRSIEQSHLTVEQRNNVSEQTAQKILDLEKQKVELMNNLSVCTSRIADLQLQSNQVTQTHNEDQTRIHSLVQQCEQAKEQVERVEGQRRDLQQRLDTVQEQFKGEKLTRKQLETEKNLLEEELTELKVTLKTYEKNNNERKGKQDQERRRWQDDLDEQKQNYEKELDELRAKLRKQRNADSLTSNQEITRIEEDLAREWQGKLDRQQTAHERLLASKVKELEQLKSSFNEQQTKLEETREELSAYEERSEKLQERLALMKEKLIEMQEEQSQSINDEVKRAMNLTFQRLKTRFQVEQQYTGEEILSRSLEVIKKVTVNILSNSEEEEEESTEDRPSNGENIDQQTLTEEVTSTETEQPKSNNGWDTVDDLHSEDPPPVEPVVTKEEEETTVPPVPDDQDSETVESTSQVELPKDPSSEGEENDESFQSARPSVQEAVATPPAPVPRYTFNENMPLMTHPDNESEDELFK